MFHHFDVQQSEGFYSSDAWVWMRVVMEKEDTFQQESLEFSSNCWLKLVTHLTRMSTINCCAPLLIVFQYWPLWIPELGTISFFYVWVSVHHKLIYIKRTNVMQLGSMFICNCNIALHVSDAFCVHLQEYLATVEAACGVWHAARYKANIHRSIYRLY